jgi:hypothetical protein
MAPDWHFFNHGALFSFCGMRYPEHDPVADWYARQEIGLDMIQQPFKSKVIEGLDAPIHVGNLTWGHVICAAPHAYWDDLYGFLCGVATVDHRQKLYAQTYATDVEILDPVLTERYSVLKPDIPFITVTVVCADTNKGRWEVQQPLTPAGKPKFFRGAAREEVLTTAKAALSGDLSKLQDKSNTAFDAVSDKLRAFRRSLTETPSESNIGDPDGRREHLDARRRRRKRH